MKKLFILLITLLSVVQIITAQELNPKRLKLVQGDIFAQRQPRLDANGKKCAVIKVDVVGIKDLKFKEAKDDVDYSMNEYLVYVPEGTKTLTYNSSSANGVIQLEDYGPEIEGGQVYQLMLETANKMRSAIFFVKPTNALLTVNGKQVDVSKGATSIDLPIGSYRYVVEASGYKSQSGNFELTEDDINITKDIDLQPVTYDVNILSSCSAASLFVDGKSYGPVNQLGGHITLSQGKHEIRAVAEGYKDYNSTQSIYNDGTYINISMDKYKDKVIRHNEERTRSSISLRSHIDFMLSGHTTLDDDMKSYIGRFSIEGHQYLGYFGFKEGISFGGMYVSDKMAPKIDDAYITGTSTNLISGTDNKLAFYADIPLQIGFALPINRYNTSQVLFMAGMYGSLYYIGHAPKNTSTKKTIETETWDYGFRVNVNFYFNKFILSFEGNRSISKAKLGTYVGVGIGLRLFNIKTDK